MPTCPKCRHKWTTAKKKALSSCPVCGSAHHTSHESYLRLLATTPEQLRAECSVAPWRAIFPDLGLFYHPNGEVWSAKEQAEYGRSHALP